MAPWTFSLVHCKLLRVRNKDRHSTHRTGSHNSLATKANSRIIHPSMKFNCEHALMESLQILLHMQPHRYVVSFTRVIIMS